MAWLRTYIFRSTHQWIVDHDMTPYLLVDGLAEGVEVPEEYLEDGQIVLSLCPHAVRDLEMNDEGISFTASFSGDPLSISVPYLAVLSLYAKESGQGVYTSSEEEGEFGLFVEELDEDSDLPDPPTAKKKVVEKKKLSDRLAKSGLKVVK